MTSIEFLEMEIVKLESKFAIPHAIYELCEQAKEMHKQEIIDAVGAPIIGEQYYNETFKKD